MEEFAMGAVMEQGRRRLSEKTAKTMQETGKIQ